MTSIGRLVGVATLQDVRAALSTTPKCTIMNTFALLQLTDAIEGKKKPPSRDEADTSALEMVQMAETDSEVENPL